MQRISGHVVDVIHERVFPGEVRIEDGRIVAVEPIADDATADDTYLLPGFVDAHVHVESSMLTPGHFAAAAVNHGTVATVSDPHEIANVLGVEGVQFMLNDAEQVPFKFMFGVPSCVPATPFETAGAELDVEQTRRLLDDPRIGYLSEMMDWPGVLRRDPKVMAKIDAARQLGKPVDGHAPGLRGDDAARYHAAGIATDHECFTLAEAHDKLAAGAMIQIREGSAARNMQALWSLIDSHPGRVMLCSDDKHPNDLVRGHINQLCARLIGKGANVFNLLRAACVVPVEHYGLPVGLLRPGDPADLIEVNDLTDFEVRRTWIDGRLVSVNGRSLIQPQQADPVNRFDCQPIKAEALRIDIGSGDARIIAVDDGELITRTETIDAGSLSNNGTATAGADIEHDLLKIAVVNRYRRAARPSVAFVRGFGLKHGAIAGSVGHDSHNIIAVGATDDDLAAAINAVIAERGGLSVADGEQVRVLPLPIAGLMSPKDCRTVAREYETLDAMAHQLGTTLRSPFMTLSFMALLVIPSLKLSDRGLFDSERFEFTSLFTG